MGKSYVLRNEQGKPVGYLAQGLHAICCRIAAAEADEVVVFFQDGSHRRRRVEHACEEMEWREENCAAEGAVALERGRVSAATGEEARRKWSEMEYRKKARKTKEENEHSNTESDEPENKRQVEQTKREEIEERGAGIHAQNACALPQRRWPPPPCWKMAVYSHGAWTEEKA